MDIYYPLFEEVLNGKQSPEKAENADGVHFVQKMQRQVVQPARYKGAYQLSFFPATTAKGRYYEQLLLRELDSYCCDIAEALYGEKSEELLRYRRKQLLSDHLTTSLIRLGEHLKRRGYRMSDLQSTSDGISGEHYVNSYIYHLLKFCLIKAYLEIQHLLSPIIVSPLDERILRTTLVGEEYPIVQLFLQRLPQNVNHKSVGSTPNNASEKETKPSELVRPFYNAKEVCEILKISDSTLSRRVKEGVIFAIKEGKSHRFPKKELDAYVERLFDEYKR